MKINQRFQDLHSESRETDWVLLQQVERDICLLYHQLSDYSYIMGDLYYGSVFALPYWEFLNISGVDPMDQEFIRDGCLVMILAMAWDQIYGSGAYINDKIAACEAALAKIKTTDERTQKLIRTVRQALEIAQQEKPRTEELEELSMWVHKEYVEGYFRRIVEEFDTNPYYKGQLPGV